MPGKSMVLLVGGGGIGAVAAYNLEIGGLASVTVVLRSNYEAVKQKGYTIHSIDHGFVEGFRPTKVVNKVPDVITNSHKPFDYIICCTKNVPDVPPTLVDIIKPAVTEGHSTIVLIQNGLNIEKPVLEAFPKNICLSGISRCGADELSLGHIEHNDPDRLLITPWHNPNLDLGKERAVAEDFIRLYSASGMVECTYEPNVAYARWRKLMYNAVWNPICALTDMDTTRFRLASDLSDPANPVELLVRPALREVITAAKAVADVDLPESDIQSFIDADPMDVFILPSMQQDIRKKRYTENENILGEVLREGEAVGVSMPTLKALYGLLKARQWLVKEQQGVLNAVDMQKQRLEGQ